MTVQSVTYVCHELDTVQSVAVWTIIHIWMTTMPPRAPQIAILPGEHVQGACWTEPMENYANRHEGDTTKIHAPIPAVFQSSANRPTFVVPPPSEKCG